MNEVIDFMGQWTWWIVAAVMFLLELAVTAFFFLWLGVAAILTAIIDMFVDLGWQSELAIFAAFSVISLVASRYIAARRQPASDRPMLNRRGEALIGREFTLEKPIKNGRGWVRVADSIWQAEGPDLDAGTRIRVAKVRGTVLIVERAGQNA